MTVKLSAVRDGCRHEATHRDLGIVNGFAVSEWRFADGTVLTNKVRWNPEARDFDGDRMKSDDDYFWGLGFRRWRTEYGPVWLPGDPHSPAARARRKKIDAVG